MVSAAHRIGTSGAFFRTSHSHRGLKRLVKLRIPPTAVGGWFRSFLQLTPTHALKSHQRQLVDCSDPFYNELDTPNKTSYSALHEPHTLQKPHVGLSTSLLPLFSHPSQTPVFSFKRVAIEGFDN